MQVCKSNMAFRGVASRPACNKDTHTSARNPSSSTNKSIQNLISKNQPDNSSRHFDHALPRPKVDRTTAKTPTKNNSERCKPKNQISCIGAEGLEFRGPWIPILVPCWDIAQGCSFMFLIVFYKI